MVLKDSQHIFSKEATREEHVTWERDIHNIRVIFKDCIRSSGNNVDNEEAKENKGQEEITNRRPDCPTIFPLLSRYKMDFQWQSQGAEHFRRFKVPIRLAFQSMILLIFNSIVKMPWTENSKEVLDLYEQIQETYSESNKYLVDLRQRTKEEVSWDISVPEVCEMRRYLWQDFEQPTCEKRWKKTELSTMMPIPSEDKGLKVRVARSSFDKVLSLSKSDLVGGRFIKRRNKRDTTLHSSLKGSDTKRVSAENEKKEIQKKRNFNKEEDDDEDDNDEDDDDEDDDDVKKEKEFENLSTEDQLFFSTFAAIPAESDNDKESNYTTTPKGEQDLGGSASDFDFILKGRFTDLTKIKEIVVEKREIKLQATTKGEIIEEMIDKAYVERSHYTDGVVAGWDEYMGKTYVEFVKAEAEFLETLRNETEKRKTALNV